MKGRSADVGDLVRCRSMRGRHEMRVPPLYRHGYAWETLAFRAYRAGGSPTYRVNATVKVLAEL